MEESYVQAGERLTASGLERLLESAPLQRRFGLSAEEAGGLTAVLQRCGFRWGLGAAERRGDPTHTLGWAIDRLLLGLVLPEPDGFWPTDTAPAPPLAPLAAPVFAGSWRDPPRPILCAQTARLGGGYPLVSSAPAFLFLRAVPPQNPHLRSPGWTIGACRSCGPKTAHVLAVIVC